MANSPEAAQSFADALVNLVNAASSHQSHSFYEIAKDFQPATAALVAVIAALIAYKAAMAKVDFDRTVRVNENNMKRLGLLFRVGIVAHTNASEFEAWAERKLSYEDLEKVIPKAPIAEFEEAWNQINLMPPKSMMPLLAARRHLAIAQHFLAMGRPDDENERWVVENSLKTSCLLIAEACNRLFESLKEPTELTSEIVAQTAPLRSTQRPAF